MKIGILTFHCADNYGAKLQAFALVSYLRGEGFDAEIINYRPAYLTQSNDWINIKRLKSSNPVRSFLLLCFWILTAVPRHLRYRSFRSFEKKYLPLSPEISGAVPDHYDAYIVGSDQIWSKFLTQGFDENYFCNFPFPKLQRKYISYAASAEIVELNDDYYERFPEVLARFDSISVRENHLKDFLQPLTPKKIYLTLDPTLILGKNHWEVLSGERIIKTRYLLFYQIRSSNVAERQARNFAKTQNLHFVKLVAKQSRWKWENYSTVSPREFVNFFMYADYVVTNSFHGTTFSIIFQKRFCVFVLNDGCDGRVTSLLGLLGLTDRLIGIADPVDASPIDYDSVGMLLKNEQDKSRTFLKMALDAEMIS